MTTIALVAGMVPFAIAQGADASFRQPMAIAVIDGLVTPSALSLLVVPVAFTYVAGMERRMGGGSGTKGINKPSSFAAHELASWGHREITYFDYFSSSALSL